MSSSVDISASKRAALEQLRFSKVNKAHSSTPSIPVASLTTPVVSIQPSYTVPPPQSRDATMSSRFFHNPPASHGTVLVPNSSPLSTDSNYRPYQLGQYQDYGLASAPEHPMPASSWGHSAPPAFDPLSAPSGFFTNGSTELSQRRPWAGEDSHIDGTGEERPPRKRVNRGSPRDSIEMSNSPESPEIQRPGQRRRLMPSRVDTLSTSSDDSLPELGQPIAGPSKSRVTRDRPTSSPDSSPSDPLHDPKFVRFKVTMPLHAPVRVAAAWQHANGDVKKATELLSDITWEPKTTATAELKYDDTGRVKEVDEATRAQRAAVKEKGKKSMIYANRSVLESKPIHSTPPPTTPVLDLSALSPATPALILPRRKRIKKMVVDSESEPELTDSDDDLHRSKRAREEKFDDSRTLDYFNKADSEALQELTGCTQEQATTIVSLRPFKSVDDLNTKLGQGKKKAGPAGISPRLFDDSTTIFKEYSTVDNVLEDCERIGFTLRAAIASWSSPSTIVGNGKAKEDFLPTDEIEDGALSLRSLSSLKQQKPKDYLTNQPSLLAKDIQLKEYQVLGVNWLNLLYRSGLSCILADEMGLGKTIQVISFFAYLKERGNKGPHLIVVPSSTLENWCREFSRFAPSISVQTYYAVKEDRPFLRQTLLATQRCTSTSDEGWEVLITTYNLAQGDDRDRKFFRRVEWDSCVFDEGHVLKNFQSQRYQALLKFESKWRLLLTGTPLQNNLQELVSLMNFILPHRFSGTLDSLRAIFKVKGDSKVTLLSQERVSRAKKMMTPFVLRRRKDQVLKDLPKKTVRIEWCDMTSLQQSIYTDTLQRSRKTIFDVESKGVADSETPPSKPTKKRGKATARTKDKLYLENSSNVLMDLRKAASHPMLFRTRFTDEVLNGMTKQLLREPDFKKRGAIFEYVKEDMTVMTDSELQLFCSTYKSLRKYLQDDSCYLDAGKVKALLKLLEQYATEGRKVLIFSQFTQILDILQAILKQKKIKYLILTGSTAVDVRQSLVDEFTEDMSISVFLLSTKAGGLGITLTAASVVIMFDQDFNPHNDRQAQDRAYRIGQKRDVEVVKLISRGTIEEDMLKLGETKLALDEAVAGETEDEKGESAPEREMKTSLMNVLRLQFEKQQETEGATSEAIT